MDKSVNLHWLDRSVGTFFPSMGYRMALARYKMESLKRNYDAAKKDNLWINWIAKSQPSELQDAQYRPIMIARCRDLERNSDTANSISKAIKRNVVGKGLQLQSRVRKKPYGEMEEESIKAIETYWKEFIENCDYTSQFNFRKICAMIEDRLTYDGEIFIIKVYEPKSDFPFQLQIMEVDQLDMTQYQNGTNRVYSGIEVDPYNRPVAYWFRRTDPMGHIEYVPERVAADQVIHLSEKNRPSQIHGIPRIAKSVSRIRDIDSYLEAENVKSRLAACFGISIESEGVGLNRPIGPAFQNHSSYDGVEVSPGMIARLNPGDKINVIAPNLPTYMGDYTRINARMASSGQGFSYEQVSRDYSQTNYSSARQGLLEDQKTFGEMQEDLIDNFCKLIFRASIEAGVLSGRLRLRNFFENPEKYYEHKWIPPGWSWIDPVKEVKAQKEAIAAGLTTIEEVCASSGKDWAEVFRQQAREKEEAERLGLQTFQYIWDLEKGGEPASEDEPEENGQK